ncbi:MAG: hypothetical protein ACTHVE_06120 [Senegalia sp. (in: firmicutes)]|uniref:hypothetical protein n=1 Tax=Senegalia sp. (in: firmicutes) TaxID=1924098 RepID=UPI003F9E1EE4
MEVNENIKAIVIPYFEDKFVMSFNSKQKCWEFPIGEVSENESLIQSSIRQVFERCGAISEYLQPLGMHGKKYIIYLSKIAVFEPKPRWSDSDLVKLFEDLPNEVLDKDRLLYESA